MEKQVSGSKTVTSLNGKEIPGTADKTTATQYIVMSKPSAQPMLQTTMESYKTLHEYTEAEIQSKMLALRETSVDHFREYRYEFILSLMSYMMRSTEMDEMIKKELYSNEQAHLTRKCEDCGALYPARKMKCDICKGKVSSVTEKTIPIYDSFAHRIPKFFDIGQNGRIYPCKIESFEPILLNPNSYENITSIVDEKSKVAINQNPEGRK